MWFSVGIVEVFMIAAMFIVAAILAVFRHRAWRWAMVGVFCAITAALFTPADPASMILLGPLFFVFFVGGMRFGRPQPIAAG